MICSNCGLTVDDDKKKCPYCGKQLVTAEAEESGKAVENKEDDITGRGSNVSTVKKGSGGAGRIKRVLAWIVLTVIAAGAVFRLFLYIGAKLPQDGGDHRETEIESVTEETESFAEETGSESLPEEDVQSGFIFENSDRRYLTRGELENLSAEELRIARNEIYARKGRKFQSEDLQNYFESQDWYQGTIEPQDFVESSLNEYEIANRDLILLIEKENRDR